MVVNPFWFGVFVGVVATLAVIIIWAIIYGGKK